jgi:uncharacterized protein (DUF433 family)
MPVEADFLTQDQHGGIWLRGHRIGLHHLLWYYNEGFSAEELREQFPTLSMAEIHQVLGYYWRNKQEIDAYLAETQKRLDSQRGQVDKVDLEAMRQRLVQGEFRTSVPG